VLFTSHLELAAHIPLPGFRVLSKRARRHNLWDERATSQSTHVRTFSARALFSRCNSVFLYNACAPARIRAARVKNSARRVPRVHALPGARARLLACFPPALISIICLPRAARNSRHPSVVIQCAFALWRSGQVARGNCNLQSVRELHNL
jgi:hypothetical protein